MFCTRMLNASHMLGGGGKIKNMKKDHSNQSNTAFQLEIKYSTRQPNSVCE